MARSLAALLIAAPLLLAAPAVAADADLESYLDGLFEGLMDTHHVPGAVVVVVRDGRVLLAKGYGVADVATGRPVDAERTRFRVASISKLFVATAVMQLVEQGALDLDADVNGYLEAFQLAPAYGAPVTLRNLLTHTGGFDDRFLWTAEPLEESPTQLGAYLAERMPPRVMPPGDVISYSNHGYALAGHLVERASGLPFGRYVAERILRPLGMTHSSFGIPTPVPGDAAVPYQYRGGRHHDLGYDRLKDGPAGDLFTTGADMARFMLAHLGDGALGDARILQADSAREMRRRHFAHLPDMRGWGLGFADQAQGGVAAVGHGGSWRGFGSALTLVPEAGLGWFVSTNHDFHPEFFRSLRGRLWDHFFPGTAPSPELAAEASPGEGVAGVYIPNRRVRTSFLKLAELLQELRIEEGDDGTLVARAAAGGPMPRRLVPVGGDRYVSADGRTRVAFQRDGEGRVEHAYLGSFALDRVPAWRSPFNQVLVGAALALLFVGTLVGWALGALARLAAGAPPSPTTPLARAVASIVCAVDAGLVIYLGQALAAPDIWKIMVEVPPATVVALWLPVLSLPLTVMLPVFAIHGFRADAHAPLARLHYALVTAGAFLFLAGAWFWNLTPLGL